jgi:hypothetical protein
MELRPALPLYPGTPPSVQIKGKPATNQPPEQGYIVTHNNHIPDTDAIANLTVSDSLI